MRAFLLCLLCGALHVGGEVLLVLSLGYALEADVNQGVMCSVYAVSIVVVLLGSMTFLREKLRPCQIVGIVFVLGAIICIGFVGRETLAPPVPVDPATPEPVDSPTPSPEQAPQVLVYSSESVLADEMDKIEDTTASLLFILGASICFGLRALLLKFVTGGSLEIDSMSATIVYLLADGVVGLLWFIVVAMTSEPELADFTGQTVALGIMAGLLIAAGIFSLNLALTVGATGPAYALAYSFPIL